MSTPIDDDHASLRYAPPWARQDDPLEERWDGPSGVNGSTAEDLLGSPSHAGSERHLASRDRLAEDGHADASFDHVSDSGAGMRGQPRGDQIFSGDIAVRAFQTRLSLDPELVPEPMVLPSAVASWSSLLLLAGLCALAITVAFAAVLTVFTDRHPALLAPAGTAPAHLLTAKTREDVSGAQRNVPIRLVVVGRRRGGVDERMPLGVALTGAMGDGAVIIGGIVPGSRITAGRVDSDGRWRVSLIDLGKADIVPPPGFAGVMELAIELRLADETVADHSTMQITWGATPGASASAAAAAGPEPEVLPAALLEARVKPAAEDIAVLVNSGREFIANGDFPSARLLLRRAADGGDAQAALLLGSTYDPVVLRQRKLIGAAADPEQARLWYQRAAELGSVDAGGRLAELARGR